MLKYAVLFLFAVRAFADAPCCEEKERSISYLDIAADLISKAKNNIPECQEKKECPKPKECPNPKECPKPKECPEIKECPNPKECPKPKECPEIKECPDIITNDCADWYERGYNKSGVYNIRPMTRIAANKSLDVFCDMDTDGGGWTVIQRRGNFGKPDDYFYKDWNSYKEGFGDIDKDFWLGNDNIFALTHQKAYSIRFDLQAKDLEKAYANYSNFWIDDEAHKYMLHISNYSGNAGDSMSFHNGRNFTTKDQDNDDTKTVKCAIKHKSAWWYYYCRLVELNGLYNVKSNGIFWNTFRTANSPSLIWTEMKIRPKHFSLNVL